MQDTRPIGLFDSGIGGLTVLREALHILPHEQYIYIGDTKHVPYGTKSPDLIRQYAIEITQMLLKHDIKALVVACNTVSAVALDEIRKLAGTIPVIDVINPTIRCIPKTSGTIAIIATQATVSSHRYKEKILQMTQRNIIEKTPSLFVPLIEHHYDDIARLRFAIVENLTDLKHEKTLDTLILGCMHYAIIKEHIAEFFGEGVKIVDSSIPAAQLLKDILIKHNMRSTKSAGSVKILFTSEHSLPSMKFARKFLGNGLLKKSK
jgi:glutamate racemase